MREAQYHLVHIGTTHECHLGQSRGPAASPRNGPGDYINFCRGRVKKDNHVGRMEKSYNGRGGDGIMVKTAALRVLRVTAGGKGERVLGGGTQPEKDEQSMDKNGRSAGWEETKPGD